MSFFDRVLPATGPFTLFTGVTGPDGKLAEQRHWNNIQTHEELEKKIQQLSTLPLNVFYATGSYAGPNRGEPVAKRALWLDLDFKDFDGSIQNALRGLSVFVKATGLPPPSCYVHSGRGVHVYWCLDRDVTVTEWLPVAKALKEKCAELDFAADPSATSDAKRILRAPGTLNRKEVTPLPCRVLSDNGTVHSLEAIAAQLGAPKLKGALAKLAALAPADALVTKTAHRDLKAEEIAAMLAVIRLPPINSRDIWTTILCAVQDWCDKSEEGWELFHEWCTTQPGYSNPDTVRKEWDSFTPGGGITVGTLVKLAQEAGYVPPGTPAPVVPASLSEQVADPNGEEAGEPVVEAGVAADSLLIAAQYAVNATGKIRFEKDTAVQFLSNEFVLITEQADIYYSITNRQPMEIRVIDNLLTRYMPLNASGVPIEASKIMRRFGVRHAVQALGFHPKEGALFMEDRKTYVNQYSAPDDLITGQPQEIALIEDFWKYMFPTDDDQSMSDYLRCVFAYLVKHPEIKIDSAPLIVSPEQGTGKTTLAYEIPKRLVGVHNSTMVSNKTLRGSFSGYVNGRKFLHFDEIHINGKWDSDDTANGLKSLVAGSVVEVRPLYMNSFNIRNRLWVSATSNYDDAMSLPNETERRWAVYAHKPIRKWTQQQREQYFSVLYRWLNSPRAAGVLRWYFAQTDVSKFNPAAPPPVTAAKLAMVKKSQIREVRLLQDAIEHSDAPFHKELFTNESVRQYLHAETGKTYSSVEVRDFVHRAVPESIALKVVRTGSSLVRPICWKNKQHWMDPNRTTAEIKAELT